MARRFRAGWVAGVSMLVGLALVGSCQCPDPPADLMYEDGTYVSPPNPTDGIQTMTAQLTGRVLTITYVRDDGERFTVIYQVPRA